MGILVDTARTAWGLVQVCWVIAETIVDVGRTLFVPIAQVVMAVLVGLYISNSGVSSVDILAVSAVFILLGVLR